MEFAQDTLARFVACGAVITALLLARLPRLRRFERWAYGLAAVLGAAAFFNFGSIHHSFDPGADTVNLWEQYHYQLGSKYFPELGFDGLYAASLAAQQEIDPGRSPHRFVRHLPTNALVRTATYGSYVDEVRARFTPERWRSFVADHEVYRTRGPSDFLDSARMDHGYNPSPTWTFVARLFSAWLPSGYGSLVFLASLDVLALAGLFLLLFRTCGYRTACLALALCGLGFRLPYLYLGSFLRLDWLLAVGAGICLLRRGRPALAGGLLGYATLVRVFPVLFLVGPLLLACKGLWQGRLPHWVPRFAAGLGLALALGAAAGCLAGRGPDAWLEFGERMAVYSGSWTVNLVGLDTVFLTGPNWRHASGAAPAMTGTGRLIEHLEAQLQRRRLARVFSKAALVVLACMAMWQVSLGESALLGLVLIFALANPADYYWIVLLLVPLYWRPSAVLGLLSLFAVLHGLQRWLDHADWMPWLYSVYALGLLALFVAWSLDRVWRRSPGRR